jgi:hypothetical protein
VDSSVYRSYKNNLLLCIVESSYKNNLLLCIVESSYKNNLLLCIVESKGDRQHIENLLFGISNHSFSRQHMSFGLFNDTFSATFLYSVDREHGSEWRIDKGVLQRT